jgi:hypothetical protein
MTQDPHDELATRLARALEAADPIPGHVLAAAHAAIGWRTIDAELAELLHDDAAAHVAGVRGGAGPRHLTFAAGEVELELLVGPEAAPRIDGQVVPPGPATIELQTIDGTKAETRSDELGRFCFASVAGRLVRLAVRGDRGPDVLTPWVAL